MFGFKSKKKSVPAPAPVVLRARPLSAGRTVVSPEEAAYELEHSNLSAADRAELDAISEVQRTGRPVRQVLR